MIEGPHDQEVQPAVELATQTQHDPGVCGGHQGESPSPQQASEKVSEQVRLVIVRVNKIDLMPHHNVSDDAKDPGVKLATVFDFIKGQATGPGHLPNEEVAVPG